MLREVSFRRWLYTPIRTLVIVLGVALGVALFAATRATADSMMGAFREVAERVAGRADLVVESPAGVPNELVAAVSETEGVAHAALNLEVTTEAPEIGESLLVLGVDMLGDLHFLPFQTDEGAAAIEDPLAFVNEPNAILISKSLAKRHGIQVGGKLALGTSTGVQPFMVRGILDDSGPVSSFGGQVAVMFLDAAQVAFARGVLADRIDVALEEGASQKVVAERLQKALGGSYQVHRPEQLSLRLQDLSEPLRAALWTSGVLALLVGMFLIYNAVGIAVTQRQKEIAILRAIGVTRRGVVALFCAEAALVALPGIALGIPLARELARRSTQDTVAALHRLYAAMPSVEPNLSPALMLQAAAAGLLSAVGAALWPALRAARIDPASGLRASGTVGNAPPPPAVTLAVIGVVLILAGWLVPNGGSRYATAALVLVNMVGAALMAPAIVLLVRRTLFRPVDAALGVPARLGLDNVERTLGRASVNVLALMVAVGMSVSVGGWLASFERSIGGWFEQVTSADLAVTAGSPILDRRHLPMNADVIDKVRTVPGVDAIQPFRFVEQRLGDSAVQLVATDTEVFLSKSAAAGKSWEIVGGEAPIGPRELVDAQAAVVSENAANRLGLSAGDRIRLATPKGELEFSIRAIIVDYTSEKGAVFIDRGRFVEHWGDESVDALSLYLAKGQDTGAVADRVRAALGGGKSFFVTETTQLKRQLIGALTEAFSYSTSVELITLIIALLGVVGTMAAAILDRTREIGMLRAVGATRRQVVTSIVVESAFLGFCAVVGGIAVGVQQCWLMLDTLIVEDTGWNLTFAFPYEGVARIGILVIVTAGLAGLGPALRAARLEPKEALSYE